MSKVEQKIFNNIRNNVVNKEVANTKMDHFGHSTRIYLHDNTITIYNHAKKTLHLTDSGYCTKTTQSRLNIVLKAFNLPYKIIRSKGRTYLESDYKRSPLPITFYNVNCAWSLV